METITVRTFAATHTGGYTIAPHSHGWSQLIYAAKGVMVVHAEAGIWVVPPTRAVWVPPAIRHSIELRGVVEMRTLYLSPYLEESLPQECCVLNVSPLLRELILHAIGLGSLDSGVAAERRVIGIILDQLERIDTVPMRLPLPRDPRALAVATALRADAEGRVSLEEASESAGASRRTIERVFREETGLSLGRWRQQSRLMQALVFLADGRPVTEVAMDVGYASPSAFIGAFKRLTGSTPSRHFGAAKSEL